MKNRYLPFGYQVVQGVVCAEPQELHAVIAIYAAYQAGQSYAAITQDLIRREVCFIGDRSDWDKSRVKRVLQNKQYLGTNMLPQLVDDNTFATVQSLIATKTESNRKTPTEVTELRSLLHCHCCDKPLSRQVSAGNDIWYCRNNQCGVRLAHIKLMGKLRHVVNRLIVGPDSIQVPVITPTQCINPFAELLQEKDAGMDWIVEQLQQISTEVYKRLDSGKTSKEYDKLHALLLRLPTQQALHPDTIQRIAKRIYIAPHEVIAIELYTGQQIEWGR